MGEIKHYNGSRPPTPSEFVASKVEEFYKENQRQPTLILMSSDVLRDLYKELKALGLRPPNAPPFSVALMLREPMTFRNIEIALIGGSRRMALV